ncbi:MAG: hypothetical protein ABI333_10770 [bacterium]
MIGPLEICVEELYHAPEEAERFVRCVALPGGEPGLALDREGEVQWMVESPEAYGLWVSADNQLVLLRGGSAGPVAVERGGRSMEAPSGQPVILLDQDELRINGRRLRIHVHGETEAVYEPERLSGSALGRLVRAAAAAATLVLGGAAATTAVAQGAGSPAVTEQREAIEVRTRPPSMPARRPVDCAVTRQKVNRGKKLQLHATCPNRPGLRAGLHGTLLDPKTMRPLDKGTVIIKSVSGGKIVAEASYQRKRVRAKVVRFWIY